MTSIREEIKKLLITTWANDDMQAQEASEKLVKLAALLGNVGDHIVKCEREYNRKSLDLMNENENLSMKKVELMAQNTEEYFALREAKETQKAVLETIRSLKYFLRAREGEFESS